MADILASFQTKLSRLQDFLAQTDSQALQLVWTHKSKGIGPHDVTDRLAAVAEDLYESIEAVLSPDGRAGVARYVIEVATGSASNAKLVSKAKLERHSVRVLAGIIIGEWFNTLTWHQTWKQAA